MRVAIYARLSVDDGTRTSTHRQVADCKSFATLRDWAVTDSYVDRDTSAYQPGTHRPQWERLLTDINQERVDGVVVWKLDRLVRRSADFERFWDIAERRGASLASVTEPIDTTTELGMAIVRILVVFAQLESAGISARTRRAKEQGVAEGRPKHGGYRGFGHRRDGSIIEAEAELIRAAAERILGGESLASVCRSWRDLSVTTPQGGGWHTPHLRRLLLQPRLAGARVTKTGEWVTGGGITPILTEALSRQVIAILSDPRRVTTRPRVHDALLTGLIYCAECGSRMVTGKVRDRRVYACRDRPGRAACGSIAVTAHLADAEVTRQVFTALAAGALPAALNAPSDDPFAIIAERLARDRRMLEQLAADYYTGRTTASEHAKARPALLEQIATAEQALTRLDHQTSLAALLHVDIPREWGIRDVEWQRRVLRLLVARVDCHPATRPINVWNPARLRVTPAYGLTEQPD